MDNAAFDKHYKAFISYSHGDNREQGRKWADWLHHSLETYSVPAELVGQTNQYGQAIPAQIYPVFQDEKELSASANLSGSLQSALDRSECLIFLASPRSARSRYVQEEIRHFKKSGKSERIIALILRGEPEYGETDSEAQCFPEVLRFAVDSDGHIHHDQAEEALAADVRLPHSSEEGFTALEAYRRYLHGKGKSAAQIREKITQYDARLQLAKLKIIAAILGVPLAELTRRDQAYQLEKIRRKNRNIKRVAAAIALLAVVASVSGVYAWRQKNVAQANLAQSLYITGINKLAQHEYGEPAAYVAAAVRNGSTNAAQFAESMLAQREDMVLLPNMVASDLTFSPDGHYLAGFADQGDGQFVLQLWDARERTLLAEIEAGMTHTPGPVRFDAENRLYALGGDGALLRYDPAQALTETVHHLGGANGWRLLAVSPDGHWLMLNHYAAGEVVLLPSDNPGASRHLPSTETALVEAVFSADSRQALLWAWDDGSRGQWLRLDDTQAASLPFAIAEKIETVRFAPDGRQVLLHSARALHLLDTQSGALLAVEDDGRAHRWADFNRDGETLMSVAGQDYAVYARESGKRLALYPMALESLNGALQPQALLSAEGMRKVVTLNKQSYLQNIGYNNLLLGEFSFPVDTRQVQASTDGVHLFSLTADKRRIDRSEVETHRKNEGFITLPEDADYFRMIGGGYLMAVTADKTVRFYDAASGAAVGKAVATQARAILINQDHTRFLARTNDGFAIWNITDGNEVFHHQAENGGGNMAVDGAFRYVLSVGDKDWQLTALGEEAPLLAGEDSLTNAVFSDDGKWLALAHSDGQTDVYHIDKQEKAFSLPTISTPLLRFSPDGKTLLAAQGVNRLRLWDTASGKTYGQAIAMVPDAQLSHFSTDSRFILVQDYSAGSLQHAVRLVDAASGNPVSLPFAQGIYEQIQTVDEGKRLVTTRLLPDDLRVQVWQVPMNRHLRPEQLAADLEAAYGRQYDAASGAVNVYRSETPANSWYAQDIYTRSVSPDAQTTIIEAIERLMPISDSESLQLLSSTYFYHPLARAALAEYFARQNGADALSRYLAELTRLQLAALANPALKRQVEAVLARLPSFQSEIHDENLSQK